MGLVFFKTPSNKKFNYRPLYYDQKKEEREQRLKTAYEEDSENYEKALRDRMAMRWKRTAGTRARSATQQRLIIIFIAMALIVYFVFFM
jgi:Flp pilus assembly protein TadB